MTVTPGGLFVDQEEGGDGRGLTAAYAFTRSM